MNIIVVHINYRKFYRYSIAMIMSAIIKIETVVIAVVVQGLLACYLHTYDLCMCETLLSGLSCLMAWM